MNNKKMEIQKYNEDLILKNEEIIISDYVKKINEKFYNIAIQFINDFLELVDKDVFCIHHELLYKYDALTGEIRSSNVLRLLEQLEFN